MKVSHNNSRKQGSASHNDRSFDVQKAGHIDQSRMSKNRYWCIHEGMSFEEAERKFYEEHYNEMLHIQNGHRKDKLGMDDYLRTPRYCPEELILQIGSVGDTVTDPAVFDSCFDGYMAYLEEWNQSHGGHMHVLNYAVHKDEATIHAHIRRVWDYTAKDGTRRIGSSSALKAAGVRVPDPDKPEGRLNNRKVAFDHMMRERWIEICEEHGITVDRQPRKDRHQKISDYKRDRRIEEIERSRENTCMIREIVRDSLGEIPKEKCVTMEDGARYVSLTMEEFESLWRAAMQMAQDKEEENRKNREADAALERAGKARAEAEALQELNGKMELEAGRLREKISGSGLLADVVREGMQGIREPGELELRAIGAAGQAYDTLRYTSVYEAMDSLEGLYLGKSCKKKDKRGSDVVQADPEAAKGNGWIKNLKFPELVL